MQRAYVFNDEKSHKFWWCETLDLELLVNHGKFGSAGKFQIKEFDTAAAASAAADKLIRQKLAKGYVAAPDFDFIARCYFDDEEYGLHRLTSHPHFRTSFVDDFYYDCADDEAPFGSDEGSDAFSSLVEWMRKHGRKKIAELPARIVQEEWDMPFLPPSGSLDEAELKALFAAHDGQLPGSQIVLQSDQVIVAIAFGEVRITGRSTAALHQQALHALRRIAATARVLGWDTAESAINRQMLADWQKFAHVDETGG